MRSSFVSSVVCLSFLSLVACDEEPFIPGEVAGSGGSAGAVGGAGQGGSAGASSGSSGGGGESAGQGGSAGASAGKGGSGGNTEGTPCALGTFKCVDSVLYACHLEKKVFDGIDTCGGNEFCNEEVGKCTFCKPGSVIGCKDDFSLSVCKKDGSGGEAGPCSQNAKYCLSKGKDSKCVACITDDQCPSDDCYDPLCLEGVCSQKPSPEGSEAKKTDDDKCSEYTCDGQGKIVTKNLEPGAPCPGGGVCNGKGSCGACTPGLKECVDSTTFRVCDENGAWGQPSVCLGEKPTCGGGECVGVLQIVTGSAHSCALLESKEVFCWGGNNFFQLGIGNGDVSLFKTKPVRVKNVKNAKQLSSMSDHTCALLEEGDIYCWGKNDGNQLGSASSKAVFEPVKVASNSKFSHISAGGAHTCAVTLSGKVECWGDSSLSQTGIKNSYLLKKAG